MSRLVQSVTGARRALLVTRTAVYNPRSHSLRNDTPESLGSRFSSFRRHGNVGPRSLNLRLCLADHALGLMPRSHRSPTSPHVTHHGSPIANKVWNLPLLGDSKAQITQVLAKTLGSGSREGLLVLAMIEDMPHAADDKTRLFHPQKRRFDALVGVPEAFCGLSHAVFPARFRLLTCLHPQAIYERSAARPTPNNMLPHARSATCSQSWFVAESTIIVERTVLRISSSNQFCPKLAP